MRERKTKEPFYASVANPRRGLGCARPVLPRTKEYGLENGNEVVASCGFGCFVTVYEYAR